jgi:thioredoxin reductase
MKRNTKELPVAVIGAGPVGLAAASHLVERGLAPVIFERGSNVGHAIKSWGHVRVFSPWSYNIDSAARSLLERHGWEAPDPQGLPTGNEIVDQYLEPLANHPQIASGLHLEAEVISITRKARTRSSEEEDARPLVIGWKDRSGKLHQTEAQAIIDASGTWFSPNPMGVDGNLVEGEKEAAGQIHYGIPDVLGQHRATYANKRVLVTGAGHSAINVVLDLLKLQQIAAATKVVWSLRRNRLDKLFGGGLNDKLPARGALGRAAKEAIERGALQLLVPFEPTRIEKRSNSIRVSGVFNHEEFELEIDRVVVATGFRPDLKILREIKVSLDPVLESPPALAPLIDPNVHSCGTVPPHGAAQLKHPSEPGFYIVGAKSYGRAPTFLMATGYEQVRSVVAEIAGDHGAAQDVRLVLPETGVCSASTPASTACCGSDAKVSPPSPPIVQINVPTPPSSCCGGPSPKQDGACCLKDHEAKSAGLDGCGCSKGAQTITSSSQHDDAFDRPDESQNRCCAAV